MIRQRCFRGTTFRRKQRTVFRHAQSLTAVHDGRPIERLTSEVDRQHGECAHGRDVGMAKFDVDRAARPLDEDFAARRHVLHVAADVARPLGVVRVEVARAKAEHEVQEERRVVWRAARRRRRQVGEEGALVDEAELREGMLEGESN